ncbi:mechanosensitive ion channel family protein [Synechococcus sp. UW179A]|uniref:mechanosensitive ion channel family protein n=1 Tax=Synechococcus sp. UW179A TaxID=2575510 RepID=UPI000E0F34DA|nr:mechanosensitive ion channel domain-containing protein [Synechococcus sp. UW179A]
MTTSSKINLEPVIQFCNELWHAFSRTAVSTQVLIIIICLLTGWTIASKAKINLKLLKAPIKPKATAASLALVLLSMIYALMEIIRRPNGIIQHAWALLLVYIILTILFQVLIYSVNRDKAEQIKKYKTRLFIPIFIGYLLFEVIQIFGDPLSLLGSTIIQLFGTPFNIGDALLITIGLYLWVNLSSLITQILEWSFGSNSIQDREVSKAIFTLIRYGLVGLGVFIIIGAIGINPTVFGLITGGLSVGIGLGLKEIISNFVSGIWLLIEGSTKPGDVINLNLLDSSGEAFQIAKITDCGLRAVTVTNVNDHSERIIPNNLFFSNQITTYTKNHNIIARKSYFGVSYGSDPNQVIRLITNVVRSHPEVLEDPEPSTMFIAYGDSSLDFYVKFFIQDVMGGIRVTSEVNLMIWKTLQENSIEIPFPQRTLHIQDSISITSKDIQEKPSS